MFCKKIFLIILFAGIISVFYQSSVIWAQAIPTSAPVPTPPPTVEDCLNGCVKKNAAYVAGWTEEVEITTEFRDNDEPVLPGEDPLPITQPAVDENTHETTSYYDGDSQITLDTNGDGVVDATQDKKGGTSMYLAPNGKWYPVCGNGSCARLRKSGGGLVEGDDDIIPPPPNGGIYANTFLLPAGSSGTCAELQSLPEEHSFEKATFYLSPAGCFTEANTQPDWVDSNPLPPYSFQCHMALAGLSYTMLVQGVLGDYENIGSCTTVQSNTGATLSTIPGAAKVSLSSGNKLLIRSGFAPIGPWFQVKGGSVYVGGKLISLIPSTPNPRVFALDSDPSPGVAGTPGVVTHGKPTPDYDFDIKGDTYGEENVSSKRWFVEDTHATKNFYLIYSEKAKKEPHQSYNEGLDGAKPSMVAGQKTSIFTMEGNSSQNLSINEAWNIGDNESFIMIVPGNLTINAPITLTGTEKKGFVAFLVGGNITVRSSVGVPATSSMPVVEGVYIANGTFDTSVSDPSVPRFVGKGSFVANSFLLQRDLHLDTPLLTSTTNRNASSELFIHNPMFYITIPDVLTDENILWQEVAP